MVKLKGKQQFWLSFALVLISVGTVMFPKYVKTKDSISNYFSDEIVKLCVNKLCLEKNGNNWLINGNIPADNELVEGQVKKFSEIRLDDLIAENSNKLAELGFDIEKKVLLEINGRRLEIGNIDNSYSGTLVKEDGKDRVYKTAVIINKNEIINNDLWEQKWITNLAAYQVIQVKYKIRGKENTIRPKEGDWGNHQVWLDKITHLPAKSFLGSAIPEGIMLEAEIEMENGRIKFSAGKWWNNKKYTYWAVSEEGKVFEIEKRDYDILIKTE